MLLRFEEQLAKLNDKNEVVSAGTGRLFLVDSHRCIIEWIQGELYVTIHGAFPDPESSNENIDHGYEQVEVRHVDWFSEKHNGFVLLLGTDHLDGEVKNNGVYGRECPAFLNNILPSQLLMSTTPRG